MIPKISIVMCVYSEKPTYLIEAIESILNQEYGEFEFIITLDNPTNSQLEQIINRYMKKDKRIIFLKNRENLGLTKSLNKAISVAKGEYILRMDADDVSEPDRVKIQFDYMLNTNTDILGSGILRIDENGKVLKPYKSVNYTPKKIKKILPFVDIIYHPTWMVKKTVYLELGSYNEVHACEDYDFLLRALKKNKIIHYIDKPLVRYRINSESISRKNSFKQYCTSKYLQKMFKSKKGYTYAGLSNHLETSEDKYRQQYLDLPLITKKIKGYICNKKYISALKFTFVKLRSNIYFAYLIGDIITYKIIGYKKP